MTTQQPQSQLDYHLHYIDRTQPLIEKHGLAVYFDPYDRLILLFDQSTQQHLHGRTPACLHLLTDADSQQRVWLALSLDAANLLNDWRAARREL